MNSQLEAVLLGIVEGVTEFLPISSTGHLLIAQHWLGRRSDLFNVAIQAGAILAVTLVYRQRILGLLRDWRRPQERDFLLKLGCAFLVTAVLGFAAKLVGAELPETLWPIATALIAGGVMILAIEHWGSFDAQTAKAAAPSWTAALAVGAAQVLAGVFPGTSRSAAAMFSGMLAGIPSRAGAAEFAFLVGIPTMFAATAYELLKLLLHPAAQPEPWSELGLAFLVSAGVGFAAVKWLLHYVSNHSFVAFAWYRIGFGILLLLLVGPQA